MAAKRHLKIVSILVTGVVCIGIFSTQLVYKNMIDDMRTEHNREISLLKETMEKTTKELETYKFLYKENEDDLNELTAEYNLLKKSIIYSKEIDNQYDSTNYEKKDLTTFSIMTINEMNSWIAERAPEKSPFRGQGKVFLEASKASGLDPKYLVAHAGLESAWGTSNISQIKHNYFGIKAYNHAPREYAESYNSFQDGIIEGALWIKDYYIDEGQNTLDKMIYGKKAYCQLADGTPDSRWISQIVKIIC